MKGGIFLAVILYTCVDAIGQGTVLFNNFVPGRVNARFLLDDGTTGYGSGWTAQLYGGPPGPGGRSKLVPLFPTTTFKTSSAADLGYVVPVVVTVPGILPGQQATIEMRAFLDKDPTCASFAAPITITLGGGDLPPAIVDGLQGITGFCIPEPPPSFIAIFAGICALIVRRARLRF